MFASLFGESTVYHTVTEILPVSKIYTHNTWEMEQEDSGKLSLA